jgi:hypothetical protein
MKRTVFAVTTSVLLAGTLALAQSQDPQTPRDSQEPQTSPSATQPSSQDKRDADVRLTGCLIQGSSPTVFILDNARVSAAAKTDEGKKYVVVMSDASGLRNQLNRQVTVTGMTVDTSGPASPSTTSPGQANRPGQSDQPGQPGQAPQAGQPGQAGSRAQVTTAAEERDLPRLSAKTIVRIADVCPTV